MVEYPEIGSVYSYFHLINELTIIEIYRLHGFYINLIVKKQMGFSDSFASQATIKRITAQMFVHTIDSGHKHEKDSGRDTCIFDGKDTSYFHNLSVRINPMPVFVCMSLVSKSRSIFLRR